MATLKPVRCRCSPDRSLFKEGYPNEKRIENPNGAVSGTGRDTVAEARRLIKACGGMTTPARPHSALR